jgi:hypothetical protein
MKNKILINIAIVLGVFLMLDTPLLAQSTGTSSSSSRESSRSSSRAVFVTPDVELHDISVGDYGFAYTTGSSSEKNSKLSLSKRYNGQSADKTGTFQIEGGVKKIRLSISGSVAVGKINLELYMPGKKELKKLTIDDSADISWSQSINVPEGDTKYYGEWTYVIKAVSVEGKYNMSISTY